MTNKITEILNRGLKEKVYPGAVLLTAQEEDIVFFYNVGNRTLRPQPLPMEKETRFDLASLTKPLATTLAAMKLEEGNLLDLDEPISSLIKPFPWKDKADITPRLLLNHSSGLADWKPYYLELIKLPIKERKPTVRRLIMEESLYEEPHTVSLYSDLGFIVLEWIIEIMIGNNLPSFLNATFYQPLGLKTFTWISLPLEHRMKKGYTLPQRIARGERKLFKAMSTMKMPIHSEGILVMPGSLEQLWIFLP